MGLATKRIEVDFTDKRIPEALAKLAETTGGATKNLVVDVDWKSFEDVQSLENLWSIWEQPLGAIEEVCSDDLGKQAIKKGLHKIVIRNVPGNEAVTTTFKSGVLTVSMNCKDGSSGTPGWTEIKKVLEDGL